MLSINPHVLIPVTVLWVLLPAYVANACATLPKGRGPPMDFGRLWPGDGRRILGPSKTWSGLLSGTLIGGLVALLQAYLWLHLLQPNDIAIVPSYGASLLDAIPVVLLLTLGALLGDALGSFVKRRLNRPSGARTLLLDQLPFVLLPIGIGWFAYPSIFVTAFDSLEAILWLLFFTLVLHVFFNWIGYKAGWKKVPW
ncbi:MAG: CDP-2,3-bis-(O-geranylgeranyl)-sn-glycerol synthase [Thermoplasmata archaeon]